MKVLYLDCSSGISGDMFLGALIDAGLKISDLTTALKRLNLKGYRLHSSSVMRNNVRGATFKVAVGSAGKRERTLHDILRLIRTSKLGSPVKRRAEEVFMTLAAAESSVHNCSVRNVHFHEVGAVDSIVDIVGAALAIEMLGVEAVYASPLTMGKPAPATLRIVRGCPVSFSPVPYELVTPTGAALYRTFVSAAKTIPPMTVTRVGYGAGSRNIEQMPNLLKAVIGQAERITWKKGTAIVVETHIDDTQPIMYEHLIDRLQSAGALDVFMIPTYAKKTRIANLLTVLTDEEHLSHVAAIIFEETTTIGLRYYRTDRLVLDRRTRRVKTQHGPVHFKISGINGARMKVMPEYEDCKKIAQRKGIPLQKVYQDITKQGGG